MLGYHTCVIIVVIVACCVLVDIRLYGIKLKSAVTACFGGVISHNIRSGYVDRSDFVASSSYEVDRHICRFTFDHIAVILNNILNLLIHILFAVDIFLVLIYRYS